MTEKTVQEGLSDCVDLWLMAHLKNRYGIDAVTPAGARAIADAMFADDEGDED